MKVREVRRCAERRKRRRGREERTQLSSGKEVRKEGKKDGCHAKTEDGGGAVVSDWIISLSLFLSFHLFLFVPAPTFQFSGVSSAVSLREAAAAVSKLGRQISCNVANSCVCARIARVYRS